MKRITGIKKRWLFNNLGFVIAIFILVLISSNFVLQGYFYSGIEQALISKSSEVVTNFSDINDENRDLFLKNAVSYLKQLPKEEKFEIMIFDDSDEVVLTSYGFLPSESQNYYDYWQSKSEGIGMWKGKDISGERIMALTRSIYDEKGIYIGAVRYVVSLENAFLRIFFGSFLIMLVEIVIIIFMFISGNYFIKSIVIPISDICLKSKLIAQGNFNVKIDKKYDDEIGQLSDSINNMAIELRESEKIKNDFISSISHELRTPLTAIKGWAETMKICEKDPDTMQKGLEIIIKESGRLSYIVEEMLDFSSIKNRRTTIKNEKVDILAELSEAIYMFKNKAESEKKSLIYSEPKMLSAVMGDKNRIKQIFINIIDNALKYTSEGGGVSVGVSEKDNFISITFTDNGCGISAEHLPNVTKKFYKANHLKRGSGIGLAIVDELVELHGGKLKIISEEGFGTTVNVSFPTLNNKSEEEENENK